MTKTCFLLGITHRCGTNFLFNLLKKHPDCIGNGPVWEDFFLKHSNQLNKYTDKVINEWNPTWEIDEKLGGKSTLLKHIGQGLTSYLELQIDKTEKLNKKPILLTKTPSVKNLDNYMELFPDNKLIILIRDGRSVVFSGEKSFDWGFDLAAKKWNNSAQEILDFKEKYKELEAKKYIIVSYESLYQNMDNELRRIFKFLALDAENYSYDDAKSMGFIGSSEVRCDNKKELHWKEVKKSEVSDPLTRFSKWSFLKHNRYNWIAGKNHQELGYKKDQYGDKNIIFIVYNILLDLTLYLRVLPRLLRIVLKKL